MHKVAAFQPERLNGRLGQPAPRFDLLVRSHHSSDDCLGRLRILFGDEVDRADGRTTFQWFGCHQYDLTICHVLLTKEERTDRSSAERSSRKAPRAAAPAGAVVACSPRRSLPGARS